MSANLTKWQLARGVALVAVWCLVCLVGVATAQNNSYGSYFTQQGQRYSGLKHTQSTSRFLYDKYFYQRQSVSPYMSLNRPGTMSGTSYQAYVRPEQQRRARQYQAQTARIDQMKRSGRVGGIHDPSANYRGSSAAGFRPPTQPRASSSAYYNHWYGSWNR